MEQIIEVFGIDWRILAIQILNFGILLGVLWYFLYQPITNLIENRRTQIIQGVADAERAAAALKDADAKKADILAAAALEAQTLIAQARETAKGKENEIMREAQEKGERILAEASLKGEEVQREALVKSKEQIAQLIVLGAEKTLRERGA